MMISEYVYFDMYFAFLIYVDNDFVRDSAAWFDKGCLSNASISDFR